MCQNENALNNSEVSAVEKRTSWQVPNFHFQTEVVWKNVVIAVLGHILWLYALYCVLFKITWATFIFGYVYGTITGIGITAGCHRLWTHRSYKARLPLRIFLLIAASACGQNDIFTWCRDHRVHHKFSDTDADPHNIKRGFFFSHMGWLLMKKHPDVIEKGKTVDVSDLLADPVVMFNRRHAIPLFLLFSFVIPAFIHTYIIPDNLIYALAAHVHRVILVYHYTWLVNSAAHMFGYRPYDKNIKPAENYWVSYFANGEGFHNYHHTFPWDYSTSELGWKLNFTTMFIDLCAKLGLAYDLKTASKDIVKKRIERSGE